MKTQINKSEIFTAAWEDYKSDSNKDNLEGGYLNTFGECLKTAWMLAKDTRSFDQVLNNESVKSIFNYLVSGVSFDRNFGGSDNWECEAETILNLVASKSNGFQSDIATKSLKYKSISTKQAWCVAYEFKNVA